jgi:hypothetical protein
VTLSIGVFALLTQVSDVSVARVGADSQLNCKARSRADELHHEASGLRVKGPLHRNTHYRRPCRCKRGPRTSLRFHRSQEPGEPLPGAGEQRLTRGLLAPPAISSHGGLRTLAPGVRRATIMGPPSANLHRNGRRPHACFLKAICRGLTQILEPPRWLVRSGPR